jgi:hypothetical protein
MDRPDPPDHFVELREVAVSERAAVASQPAAVEAPAALVPAAPTAVAIVREELVLRRRRVSPRQPANELGRGEVRIGLVRETGQPHGRTP